MLTLPVVGFHEKAGPCQANSFTSCHSRVTETVPASRPGPVQAERSEPKGSLDGWLRCHILRDEGMAGQLAPFRRSSPHRPAIRTFLQPPSAVCQLGSANLTGAAI